MFALRAPSLSSSNLLACLTNSARAGTSRLFLPCSTHKRTFVNRSLTKPVPSITEQISTPSQFLEKIGRDLVTKVPLASSDPASWDEFWHTSGLGLKKAGVGVRDRRYVLWCMAQFRRGVPVEDFAHEVRKPKTIRGWGPSVQNGKRIRSRRLKVPSKKVLMEKKKREAEFRHMKKDEKRKRKDAQRAAEAT